ncbi:hypothetical protein PHLGIDRAFT_355851 [Phlebiopsis gigantea 11061_1 CR5-6]|uniref:F-box domain-containing protein n=1 Tax=Phlebiopsis gigantea (strain 11061_1 CR5-6) TaxID=745531 RepID=A0A0C3P9R0_PHLG1|nr:hypothetical protein PHLGIDRAFT_355851 [Phlebiopsis gigantea 11061_1 CR5-6]
MRSSPNLLLPSELIYMILQALCLDFNEFDDEKKIERHASSDIANRGLKRGLAACSLTCRYWAPAVRAVLFRTLILRSADDLDQLIAFLGSSTAIAPPISSLVQFVRIEMDGSPQRPWLHHLNKLDKDLNFSRSCALRALYDVSIVNDGEAAPPKVMHIFPFQFLPRSPPLACPPIHSLCLDRLHLRQPRDLLRAISSIRQLAHCSITGVTFKDASFPDMRMPLLGHRTPLAPRRFTVIVGHCGDDTPSTQLALATAIFPASSMTGVDTRTWDTARQAVTSYTPIDHTAVRIDGERRDSVTLRTSNHIFCLHSVDWALNTVTVLEISSPPAPVHTSALPLRSISRWTLARFTSTASIQATDWELFQRILLRLEPTPTLVIRSDRVNGFRWLIKAVTDGAILGPALGADKLQLCWPGGRSAPGTDMLSTQADYMIDGSFVTLNPLERFELRIRRHPDFYLRTLLEKHNQVNRLAG